MNKMKWDEAKTELTKNGTYFLQFTTEWCGDCKMMAPVVENAENEIKKTNPGVKFIKVDAEEADLFRTADDWQVLKVPAFYKVENGKKTHIGYEYLPLEALVSPFRK